MDENSEADAAFVSLAADLVTELGAARAAEILELTGQAAGLGGTDEYGTFHPAPPPQHRNPALSHLISGGADMSHTIAGGQYMGHTLSGMARGQGGLYGPLEGAGGPQEGAEGTPVPEATEEELERRGLHEAARGGGQGLDVPLQQPDEPAGGTQRPARQRTRRDRYGRRRGALRYQGR